MEGKLNDPVLSLYGPTGELILSNDDWRSSQEDEIMATGIAPTDNRESALIATLPGTDQGLGYTAIMSGVDHSTGIGVVEVYDLDLEASSRLVNISTRGRVEPDDGVLIGGIIVLGSEAQQVILRAIGPSLAEAGLSGAMADPTLELYDSNGGLMAINDNWPDSQESEVIATGIPPGNEFEPAIVATLSGSPSGTAYTAIVRGTNNTAGVALVEVYSLSP
jgi:hypothetical protein